MGIKTISGISTSYDPDQTINRSLVNISSGMLRAIRLSSETDKGVFPGPYPASDPLTQIIDIVHDKGSHP